MVDSTNAFPTTGDRLPDFRLPDLQGEMFDISRYRSLWNLVLIFTGEDDLPLQELAREIQDRWVEFAAEDARVVFVAPRRSHTVDQLRAGSRDGRFTVLLDEDARVHRNFQALNDQGKPGLSAFVTDRYGEIFTALRPQDPNWPFGAETLLDWLRFVEIQCPE